MVKKAYACSKIITYPFCKIVECVFEKSHFINSHDFNSQISELKIYVQKNYVNWSSGLKASRVRA